MRAPTQSAGIGMSAFRSHSPMLVVVFIAALVIAACTTSPTASPSPSPETSVAATESALPTPVAAKKPAGSVLGLLARLYLALNFEDSVALAALTAPGAMHSVYLTDGVSGEEVTEIALEEFDIAADPMVAVAPWPGPSGFGAMIPMVVGNAVAVPVRYQYPDGYYYGFDLLSLVPVSGGYLIGNGATAFGPAEGQQSWFGEPDPSVVAPVDAEVAAWNADNVDALMTAYTDDAAFWSGVAGPERTVYTGEDLRQFVTDSLWFEVAVTGPQVGYGTFIASPNSLTSESDMTEGISVHDIRDGRIALHVYLSGD